MNLPGGSSYPGYLPPVPPKPPDIKGEYIEECDDIKEETEERLTPAPSQQPFLNTQCQFPMFRGGPGVVMPPRVPALPAMPPLQPASLAPGPMTPLQLIQELSNYAASNRKRQGPGDNSHNAQHGHAKKFQPSQPSQSFPCTPRIDQVMSLPPRAVPVSPPGPAETNNNSSSKTPPVSPPELEVASKPSIDCPVCGDDAVAHFHYGGMCCYSCKAFFRRVVNTNKATKYKCRAGNNQCDVSLANRRSCQACRYKKCVGAGMKPGLVLSDDQCQKKFGPKKGAKDADRQMKAAGGRGKEEQEEEADDPGVLEAGAAVAEPEEMGDEDYSVLIDPGKSLAEQNQLGRQLFVSIFSTGSVSSGQLTEAELAAFRHIDNNAAVVAGHLAERQVTNSRKFLSFFDVGRGVFLGSGQVDLSGVTSTLVDQTVLVLKQNPDFRSLSVPDQTELLETNAMVACLVTSLEMYHPATRTFAWPLTETDYQALRKLGMKTVNGRAVFGLADVHPRVEAELRDDIVKLFKFCDYFSLIGVPKPALLVLAVAVVFTHDCCDIGDKARVEEMRRRHLILLFECLAQSEGVLGACKIALKLHTAIHHLNRICQLFAQKFVTVQE